MMSEHPPNPAHERWLASINQMIAAGETPEATAKSMLEMAVSFAVTACGKGEVWRLLSAVALTLAAEDAAEQRTKRH